MENNQEISQLWSEYSTQKRLETRNAIFQYYSPWIKKISSSQYSKNGSSLVEWVDCLQNASIALMESIDRFDVTRGVPFEAFAYVRVKGAILNGFTNFKSTPNIKSSFEFMDDNGGIDFSENAEVAFDQFIDAVLDIAFCKFLDVSNYKFSKVCMNPFDVYAASAEEERINYALTKLKPEHEFVIMSHYKHYLTLTQIAKQLGVTTSRVSQLHTSAIKELRKIYENY